MIDKDSIKETIATELERSQGYWQDELSSDRDLAMSYYQGKVEEQAREEEGEESALSGYVSEDVASMVDAALAQMVPAIYGDTVVEFEATGAADEDAAQLETDLVNRAVLQSEEGLSEIIQAIHDALLLRNGILKVYMEEHKTRTRATFENVEPGTLGALLAPDVANQVVEHSVDGGVHTIVRTTLKRRLRFRAIAPERVVVSVDHERVTLDGCGFIAEQMLLTRSELVERGIAQAVAYALKPWEGDDQGAARQRKVTPDKSERAGDDSQQLVNVWDCYLLVDVDGDGVAEQVRALYAQDDEEVLQAREWPFPPYAMGTAIIVPHQLVGRSLFDNLRQVQDGKTAAVRQWIDNLAYANNNEVGVLDGAVNSDDVNVRRPGAPIRMKTQGALFPIPVPDIGGSSQMLVGFLDRVRSERGGASLDLQTASAQIAGDTAHGVERQYGAREQTAEMMLLSLCVTLVRQAFKLAHRTLRTWSPGPMSAKFRGEWQTVDPASWPERDAVRVTLGLSESERQAQLAAMGGVIQQQTQALQAGQDGVLCDVSKVHSALVKWGRLARVANPESYWIDPLSPAAQKAASDNAQKAQAASQADGRMAAMLLEIQANLAKWKQDVEYRFKYFDALLRAEVEEAKLVGAATAQLQQVELAGVGQMMQRGASENEQAREGAGGGEDSGRDVGGGSAPGAGVAGVPVNGGMAAPGVL